MEVSFSNNQIAEEYRRWVGKLSVDDPYESGTTIGILDVLRAHFLIADFFFGKESGMGGIGPRDLNLLHSAVYRQFAGFGNEMKWKDPYQQYATLIFGIVTDHPFHDANKRTGLLTYLYALHKLKRLPTNRQTDLEDFMVEIAERSLDKYRRRQDLAKRSDDADVLFIADYLKRNSRKRDDGHYSITYHELDRRLNDFGFSLANAKGNFIDVCRKQTRREFVLFGPKKERFTKVAQIGFPGWKSQVGKGAIQTVRKSTRLRNEDGVDSAVFFRGADPMNSLISQYEQPLYRLAFR